MHQKTYSLEKTHILINMSIKTGFAPKSTKGFSNNYFYIYYTCRVARLNVCVIENNKKKN